MEASKIFWSVTITQKSVDDWRAIIRCQYAGEEWELWAYGNTFALVAANAWQVFLQGPEYWQHCGYVLDVKD